LKGIKDSAKEYFAKEVNERDRAIFEAGLKLGAIYHQLLGIPIPRDESSVKALQRSLENSFKTQPYVKEVEIKIKRNNGSLQAPYDYAEISRNSLKIKVKIKYENIEVEAKLEYINRLKYPLAYISYIKVNGN